MLKKFLLFLFVNLSFSQEKLILENQHIQTGIDLNKKQYLIFKNNNFYYSKNFNSKKWDKKELKFNQIPLSADFPYAFFHIKAKNYLVHNGCGTVYEFRNDSIIRIDKSFEHKNQFMASTFVYKNEIYYFGGYGLFTFKNILTKFDFNTLEWELVKFADYSEIPEPRANSISFVEKDKLYIIGGLSDNPNTDITTTKSYQTNDIWELNLKSKKWKFLGKINKNLPFNYSCFKNTINEKQIFDAGKLYQFDFQNNKIKATEPKEKYSFSSFVKYNQETNEIFYVLENSNESNKKFVAIVENFENYNSEFVNEEPLFESNKAFKIICVITIILVLVIIFFFFKRNKKPSFDNKIILKDSEFYYRNKLINNLSIDESELLHFFIKHKNKPLPMNEVVDFFSKNDNTSYNTLTKKKDLVLNGLKQKLVYILEVDEDDLFVTQKNTEDKRIKEIQLNPQYF